MYTHTSISSFSFSLALNLYAPTYRYIYIHVSFAPSISLSLSLSVLSHPLLLHFPPRPSSVALAFAHAHAPSLTTPTWISTGVRGKAPQFAAHDPVSTQTICVHGYKYVFMRLGCVYLHVCMCMCTHIHNYCTTCLFFYEHGHMYIHTLFAETTATQTNSRHFCHPHNDLCLKKI